MFIMQDSQSWLKVMSATATTGHGTSTNGPDLRPLYVSRNKHIRVVMKVFEVDHPYRVGTN